MLSSEMELFLNITVFFPEREVGKSKTKFDFIRKQQFLKFKS